MHDAEKWSQFIECIVNEGINSSHRINALVFTRQVGNIYLHGHSSMPLLESYQDQFWDLKDGDKLFTKYFEAADVPDKHSHEASIVGLCFNHHFRQFSRQQIVTHERALNNYELPTIQTLYRSANPEDGNGLLLFLLL